MKAMVLEKFGDRLKLQDIEEKQLKPGYVKLKVKACGVCHTDLKIAGGKLPVCSEIRFPHILGHEISGRVVETAGDVNDYKVGDRVVASFYSGCGGCPACERGEFSLCDNLEYWAGFREWGGYAEKVVLPARALVKLPNTVSYEEGSIVPDAVATAYKAIKRKAGVKSGDNVLIIGAGGVGLHGLQIAKHLQANVIVIDKDRGHRDKAIELGADYAIRAEEDELEAVLNELTPEGKLDSVIDVVGIQASFDYGTKFLKKGGKYIIVGYRPGSKVSFDPLNILLEEISILGSRNCSTQDIEDCLQLMAIAQIYPVIDDVVPFEEVNEVHEELEAGKIMGRAILRIPE